MATRFYSWGDVPGNGNGFLRFGADGEIVTAALRPDLNPDAPFVILVGRGPQRERLARILCEQPSPVGVYLKHGTNRWEYRGKFAVERWSESAQEIRKHEQHAGRSDVVRVIYMRAA